MTSVRKNSMHLARLISSSGEVRGCRGELLAEGFDFKKLDCSEPLSLDTLLARSGVQGGGPDGE